MFTGIVETVGTIRAIMPRGNYKLLTIQADMAFENIELGESIAVDGCCLTVTDFNSKTFVVEASQETLSLAITGSYRSGIKVNLERALLPTKRLGGHLVSGHVDCIGTVSGKEKIGGSIDLSVSYPPEYDSYIVAKGSIAINGVSLTVNRVNGAQFSVNIIPFTKDETNVADFKLGDKVNLEFDIIGKYVEKMISKDKSKLSIDKFRDAGW